MLYSLKMAVFSAVGKSSIFKTDHRILFGFITKPSFRLHANLTF